MSLIDEAVISELDDIESEIIEEVEAGSAAGPTTRISDFMPDLSFLLSPTGPGPVDDYVDHPFNLNNSKGSARIIRGLTGLLGNLDYAIVDIVLGSVEVYQEKGSAKKAVKDEPEFNIPE